MTPWLALKLTFGAEVKFFANFTHQELLLSGGLEYSNAEYYTPPAPRHKYVFR
jgi:hypothetical protein